MKHAAQSPSSEPTALLSRGRGSGHGFRSLPIVGLALRSGLVIPFSSLPPLGRWGQYVSSSSQRCLPLGKLYHPGLLTSAFLSLMPIGPRHLRGVSCLDAQTAGPCFFSLPMNINDIFSAIQGQSWTTQRARGAVMKLPSTATRMALEAG